MRNVLISINNLGRVSCNGEQLGFSGEHNAVRVTVSFSGDAELFLASQYFRFVTDGHYSDELYYKDGVLEFTLPQECMQPPSVNCQIVGYTVERDVPTVIVKSEVFSLRVERSEAQSEQMSSQPNVFERAMEKCRAAAKIAFDSSESAEKSAENCGALESICTEKANSAESSALEARESAKALNKAVYEVNNVANALKGAKSGTVVSVKDMSPLEHPIKLKATFENGQPPVSTEMQIGDVATNYALVDPVPIPEYDFINQDEMPEGVEFNHNSGSNSVVFGEQHQKGFFTHVYEFEGHSVGAMLTDGEKYYALYLVPYTGGDVAVAIDKNKAYVQIDGGEIKEYTVTEDESKNVTIYCATCYGMGFSGPTVNYATNIDIYDCSVNVNATAVKVKVLGKNLFDVSRVKSTNYSIEQYGYGIVNNQDGSLTVRQNASSAITTPKPNTLKDLAPNLKVGETYILSGKSNATTKAIRLREAEQTWYYDETKNRRLTITEAMLNSQVYWYSGNGVTATVSNIQIELGTVATEYEPYQGELATYNVNADGSVDGVKPIYPSMTFMPDTEGVTLDVEYNRDINKAFAELQTALISMGVEIND